MNNLLNSADGAAITTTTKKSKKVPPGIKRFIESMKFYFPDEDLDFTLEIIDDLYQFKDPLVNKYLKIFNRGREIQRHYEPEMYIMGKLTDDGEIQFSDSPAVMQTAMQASVVAKRLKDRLGGTFLYFGISRAMTPIILGAYALEDKRQLRNLKVRVRPNYMAK